MVNKLRAQKARIPRLALPARLLSPRRALNAASPDHLSLLRLRMTLLYLLFGILLVGGLGWGSYSLLRYYFMTSTDLALRYRMAREMTSLGVTVPVELKQAQTQYLVDRSGAHPLFTNPRAQPPAPAASDSELDEARTGSAKDEQEQYEDAYDGDLAAIFVLPVGKTGQLLFNPNANDPPMGPDQDALLAALSKGSDLRTVPLPDGSKARILTYYIPHDSFPFLQIGRRISDQALVLNQFLGGIVGMGALALLSLGIGSWWLAGRSLSPTRRAWEQQRTFVANASHELRAPLTLIRASVEMAQRQSAGVHEDSRRQLLGNVLDDVDYMNKLVEDLLLLSRLDHQRLEMHPEPVDLPRFFTDICAHAALMAQSKQIAFSAQPAAQVVQADPIRLKQVLLILLDNAFRHTPSGGQVMLSARPQGSKVCIQVEDTGEGIPPEHLGRVFERFYKVEHVEGLGYRGSGLGLSIARSLVEAQGGAIRLESAPGLGTRASVLLPGEKG